MTLLCRFSHFFFGKNRVIDSVTFKKATNLGVTFTFRLKEDMNWLCCEESNTTFFELYKNTSSFNYYSLYTFKVYKKTKTIASMPTFIVEVGYSS